MMTWSPAALRYPLYQLGNPQLRVFRTNFFIRLVRPGTAQPEDTVQFRIPMEMTRVDVRNYLERIYNVPVAAVRTRVQHGSNRKRDYRNVRMKKPDYKVAYVQLIRRPPCILLRPSGSRRCCPGASPPAPPIRGAAPGRTDRPSRSPICFPRKSRALTAALATKTSRTGSWMSSGGGRAGTRGVVVSPAGSACDGPNKVLRVE
ncbi:39S ribosomal protein L23, mitochondrial isoform X1 [Panthera leo]|uniref:39S ribosomal protein L23, mitochondrial isoform X1 n=1 Tax=Panthera leo TaxID=9689 RepID=UPI001C6A8DFC|nr:39S ribosomal protein L23, mitochondrial isoform X1 [Panthera leo]